MRELRRLAERQFIRNKYGLWCPNCDEQIDELWPDACDYCGYPKRGYDRFEDDDEDYFEEPDPDQMRRAMGAGS